jgi:hypothetical protein
MFGEILFLWNKSFLMDDNSLSQAICSTLFEIYATSRDFDAYGLMQYVLTSRMFKNAISKLALWALFIVLHNTLSYILGQRLPSWTPFSGLESIESGIATISASAK